MGKKSFLKLRWKNELRRALETDASCNKPSMRRLTSKLRKGKEYSYKRFIASFSVNSSASLVNS